MSDTDLRALERRALATGAAADILAYFAAFLRTISTTPDEKRAADASLPRELRGMRVVLENGFSANASVSRPNEAVLRFENGRLEASINGNYWVPVALDDRYGGPLVPAVPDLALGGSDAASDQINKLTRAVRVLTDAVVNARLADRGV